MIIVCEPQCKKFSHEKFNSGFIYGLRLAYPEEEIRLYADISHIDAIKHILKHDKVLIDNVEYVPVKFNANSNLFAFIRYYFLFNRLLSETIAAGTNKIFLLSISSMLLYVIKKIKRRRKYLNIKITSVFHGAFEEIADDRCEKLQLQDDVPSKIRKTCSKIRQMRLVDLPYKVTGVIKGRIESLSRYLQDKFSKIFPLKKILDWEHSNDYKYVVLSPHIYDNAKRYIDVEKYNLHTIILPTVFADPTPEPNNEYIKFAVFGYGYSAMLKKILSLLAAKKLKSNYEIRIIGMDNSGAKDFTSITSPSPGKPMLREEMERYVADIDLFLILYDKTLHRLGCSGSILEALSYVKPVLHFDNDCINTFNKPAQPIGICCDNVEAYAAIMEDMINNYSKYIPRLHAYRNNMLVLRKQLAIGNKTQQIKDAFTW